MLCLGGAVLFAIVTVLQELSIKYTDVVEYLGLLGLFGSMVSGVQMWANSNILNCNIKYMYIMASRLVLEKQTLIASTWRTASVVVSSFSACQFIFCTLSSVFLMNMGTTALHLSLLSGNFYTLIVGMLFFNYKVNQLKKKIEAYVYIFSILVSCLILFVLHFIYDWCLHLCNKENTVCFTKSAF